MQIGRAFYSLDVHEADFPIDTYPPMIAEIVGDAGLQSEVVGLESLEPYKVIIRRIIHIVFVVGDTE